MPRSALAVVIGCETDYITYEAKLGEWKATELAKAIVEERADAVGASRAVLKEKIAEQMAPLLPGFLAKYNAADARFVGSPIDYIIFRSMSKGNDSDGPIEIVLLDIKTGDAGLNRIQKKIEAAVVENRISFDVMKITGPVASNTNQELGPLCAPIFLHFTLRSREEFPEINISGRACVAEAITGVNMPIEASPMATTLNTTPKMMFCLIVT